MGSVLVAACLLALLTTGEGLMCWVCLPEVEGSLFSKDAAVLWIANISRTWVGLTQDDFGYCPDFDYSVKYQGACNSSLGLPACIYVSNDYWIARTCGVVPKGMEMGECQTTRDYTVCYYGSDYSNIGNSGVPILGSHLLQALLLLFLLVPAFTAAF
nr:uncharacterized protein LOC128701967 [Cherax quadricarinatus]